MTPRKEKALQALLVCPTRAAAAKQAGIGESTLRSYFQDPEFKEAYKLAFSAMVEEATRQAQRSISPALDALSEIIQDSEENAQARIQAARSVLEYAMKLTERVDITERMDTLEAMLKEMEDSKNGH